jgi:hypothetical protein
MIIDVYTIKLVMKKLRRASSIFLLCIGLVPQAQAQNANRIDEEQILDQQRREKVEDIIRAREEEAKRIQENPEIYATPEKQNLVEVEPVNILPADLSSVSALVPYRVRRKETGVEVGLKYSLFDPTKYESDYASSTIIGFEELYGSAPLLEIYANYKKNLSFGSLGAELGVGIYSNDVDNIDFGDNISLSLQVISLGGKFILDAIHYEPYIAPYIGGGIYTVLYKEENGSNSFNGNTQPAPYMSAGVLAQLNWVDRAASVEAYSEGGIENTFLFAEVKQFMASTADGDPDFSTDPTLGAGLSLEF